MLRLPSFSSVLRRMIEGEVVLPVRVAMLFLFLRRLGLDWGDGLVEVANKAEVDAVKTESTARFEATSN